MPILLITRLLKAATPLWAVTVRVPERLPLLGLAPSASVTASLLSLVTTLPWASSTCTVTAGVMRAPIGVLVGLWPKASWLTAPGVTLKAADVALFRLVELALSV